MTTSKKRMSIPCQGYTFFIRTLDNIYKSNSLKGPEKFESLLRALKLKIHMIFNQL